MWSTGPHRRPYFRRNDKTVVRSIFLYRFSLLHYCFTTALMALTARSILPRLRPRPLPRLHAFSSVHTGDAPPAPSPPSDATRSPDGSRWRRPLRAVDHTPYIAPSAPQAEAFYGETVEPSSALDFLRSTVTESRLERIESRLTARCASTHLVIENLGNEGNVGACLRTYGGWKKKAEGRERQRS